MRNIDSSQETTSSWLLLKRAVSAAAFTTVLAIIPATMLPTTAMADDFIEHFPAVQLVVASSDGADKKAEPAVEARPESLVYAAESLLQTPYSQFIAGGQSVDWNESAGDDWQVSLSMLKTGTLATPTRWAMLRYTRAIW